MTVYLASVTASGSESEICESNSNPVLVLFSPLGKIWIHLRLHIAIWVKKHGKLVSLALFGNQFSNSIKASRRDVSAWKIHNNRNSYVTWVVQSAAEEEIVSTFFFFLLY